MQIEKPIKYLQKIQAESPGVDIICPIPLPPNILTSAVAVVVQIDLNKGTKFGTLIGLSKEQLNGIRDMAEKREVVPNTDSLHTFNADEIFKPND